MRAQPLRAAASAHAARRRNSGAAHDTRRARTDLPELVMTKEPSRMPPDTPEMESEAEEAEAEEEEVR